MITYTEERLSSEVYIDFLKRTDLGSQYPKVFLLALCNGSGSRP